MLYTHTEPIDAFLAAIGLDRYCTSFAERGYAFVSDFIIAPREELETIVQGIQEPEWRRLLDAIGHRSMAVHCGEATVEELFAEWKLSQYTRTFGENGYALISELLHASQQGLDRLTTCMKPAEKSRLERNLEVWRAGR
jgi:hypothetical protein